MTKLQAEIFDIQRNSCVDGPGIRTTVFFKGCNLSCRWCHNPEGQSASQEVLRYPDKCTGCGSCKGQELFDCPNGAKVICGKYYTVDEVLQEVLKDKLFYDTSGGGVTFSGGECMLQADFLKEILKACKKYGIHTAVDTAGHVPFGAFEKVLPYTDLFLYDVKLLDGEKHKKYTGADNRLILENLGRLIALGARIWVRIPVIGGVNDTEEEITAIRKLLQDLGGVEQVELLPYHGLGEHKYAALGQNVEFFSVPDKKTMALLEQAGQN